MDARPPLGSDVGGHESRAIGPARRAPTLAMVLAFIGWLAAFLLTMGGVVLVNVTFTANPRGTMLDATGWAVASLLVLLASWRWLDRVGRIFTLVLIAMNVYVLINSTSRW
jgi:hypothetical protein